MPNSKQCPFVEGEIAVFKSSFRQETYISKVQQIHIDYWNSGWIPEISKATLEQKQQFYENNDYELVISSNY